MDSDSTISRNLFDRRLEAVLRKWVEASVIMVLGRPRRYLSLRHSVIAQASCRYGLSDMDARNMDARIRKGQEPA